jgi:hypothetical protein
MLEEHSRPELARALRSFDRDRYQNSRIVWEFETYLKSTAVR